MESIIIFANGDMQQFPSSELIYNCDLTKFNVNSWSNATIDCIPQIVAIESAKYKKELIEQGLAYELKKIDQISEKAKDTTNICIDLSRYHMLKRLKKRILNGNSNK